MFLFMFFPPLKSLAPAPTALEFRLAVILFQARIAVGLPSYLPGRQISLSEQMYCREPSKT